MWLKSSSANGMSTPLFDAIVPIGAGHQQANAIITYGTDNFEAALLVRKISRSAAGWFWGYWRNVMKYRLKMVQKLMVSFDMDAALLACFPNLTRPHLQYRPHLATWMSNLKASSQTWG
jgi:hypothetical protein